MNLLLLCLYFLFSSTLLSLHQPLLFLHDDYRWLLLYQAALSVKLSLYPRTFLPITQNPCFTFGRSQLENPPADQIVLKQIHLNLEQVSKQVLTDSLHHVVIKCSNYPTKRSDSVFRVAGLVHRQVCRVPNYKVLKMNVS